MGTLLTLMFMGYNLWVPYIIGFKPSFFHGSGSILFFLGGRVGGERCCVGWGKFGINDVEVVFVLLRVSYFI